MQNVKAYIGAATVGIVVPLIFVYLSRAGAPGATERNQAAGVVASSPAEAAEGVIRVLGGMKQNLGEVRKNERLKHAFRIKNESEERVIKIRSVSPSCGCLGGREASRNVLAPGEEAQIDVEIAGRTDVKRNNDLNSITIKFEDHSPVTILFTYYVVGDIRALPERVSKGECFEKDAFNGSILLQSLGSESLAVQSHETKNGLVSIDRIEETEGVIRCLYSTKRMPVGKYEDVMVFHTNAKIDSVLMIPVSWEVVPNISLSPKSIFWGGDRGDKKRFAINSVDGQGFHVEKMEYDNEMFDIHPIGSPAEVKQEIKYEISFKNAGMTSGKVFRDKVVIKTDKGTVVLNVLGNAL